MIPEFDEAGNLPAGIHDANWNEISARFGSTPTRLRLLAGLKEALDALKQAGCSRAYLDGSFVTSKPEPKDYDACWEIAGVDASMLDPILLDFTSRRARQKAKYEGELFPAEIAAEPAGTRFLAYFQQDRHTGDPKGIIALDLGGLP